MGMFDSIKKPTEEDKALLDELVQNYMKYIEVQEYLSKKVDGFQEIDLSPLRIELRRNLAKAKESNLTIFKMIGKDIYQAQKECQNVVANLIDIHDKQFDEEFHVSQLPIKNE